MTDAAATAPEAPAREVPAQPAPAADDAAPAAVEPFNVPSRTPGGSSIAVPPFSIPAWCQASACSGVMETTLTSAFLNASTSFWSSFLASAAKRSKRAVIPSGGSQAVSASGSVRAA